jgi:dTDP-4-amino-4,6-dideoxygalactose transaminase
LEDIVDTNKIIRLSKSCIGDAEKQAVLRVLDREHLGMGVEVQQFEDALSEFFGRPTVCVINGTAALHLSLQACGVGPRDEVLVPSLTYVASFQAISATGAKPVACDVDEKLCLLDLEDAKKRITENTKVIMPVHYTGGVGDLDAIYQLAHKYDLRVIEDAAHAFGTTYQDKRIASFGDIACFSFDGIKNITSGEGGCIVTDDETILQKVKDARLLGVEKDTDKRYSGERSWDFDTTTQGWRYHMSNIMAAIGIEQLKRFSEVAKKRQYLAKKYDRLFSDHPNIYPIPRDYETVVPHIYVVRIYGMKNRKEIQEKLLKKGIQTGYHYQPNHWLELFKEETQQPLPLTDSIFSELLTLPLHPDLNIDDVNFIASKLINILKD